MRLIIGLGNPGLRYKWNRHNVGFHTVDFLAKKNKIRFRFNKVIHAYIGKVRISGEEIILAKPDVFMNHSGFAVKDLCDSYGVSPQNILVVLDDLDLPWGKIRIRKQGSSAGHRGMESIIESLKTMDFPRIRMGIGRPAESGAGVIKHVLGNFGAKERKELNKFCKIAAEAVYAIITENIDYAMNRFN